MTDETRWVSLEVGMSSIAGEAAVAWIDEYVQKKPKQLIPVAQGLRRLMKRNVAGLEESVNPWKIPTFESNGPLCFFMVGKNHVTFGFLRGTALEDPAGLLEGTGKSLRHVKLRTVGDLKRHELGKLIAEAVKLNSLEPTEGMRVKQKERIPAEKR